MGWELRGRFKLAEWVSAQLLPTTLCRTRSGDAGLYFVFRLGSLSDQGEWPFVSGGVHSDWRELLFGEASRADCPPAGCGSQGK